MTKSVRNFGIVATSLFVLSLFFKLQHWPGAAMMLFISTLIFVLVFLPIQLMNQYRDAKASISKLYLIIRFITFFIIILGFTFKVMHFPGSGALLFLSKPVLLLYLICYFILRKLGNAKLPIHANDIIITIIAFSIFHWVTISLISPSVGFGYFRITEQYEKINLGIKTANDLIYKSSTEIDMNKDKTLVETIIKLEEANAEIFNYLDSIKNQFALFCTKHSYEDTKKYSYLINAVKFNLDYGPEFFITDSNGVMLKSRIMQYKQKIIKIMPENPLLDIFIDLKNVTDKWGYDISWEESLFYHVPVNNIFSNLTLLENNLRIVEYFSLKTLINGNNTEGVSELLLQLGKKEADLAIEKQKNELVRVKQEQAIKDLELEASKAQLTQQTTLTVVAFLGIGFVLVMLIIATRAYVKKQRDAKKLGEQKQVIENNHYEISASIDYAKRLQTSILPLESLLKKYVKDQFVFFNPKDKVSGDFYWWTHIEGQTVITAADCTGHGVPGAFMSMLGISLLREIVTKEYITHPGVILRKLRKDVVRILKQKGEIGEQKDGMDISVISINDETKECQYAGANNPLYLIRNHEMIEYKADRMPIAIYQRMDNFTTHVFQLEQNDQLYLFSDGFADQFGGPEGKKFKYKSFKNLLLANSSEPFNSQKIKLEHAFTEWKGDQEQIDDVVVVGLKI